MGRKRIYDIEIRALVTNELKTILEENSKKLEVKEADLIRMLIRNLGNKGLSILE